MAGSSPRKKARGKVQRRVTREIDPTTTNGGIPGMWSEEGA